MPHKVADGLLVVLDVGLPVAGVLLDILMHRHGFDHAPLHACGTDGIRLSTDLLDGPNLARPAAIERRNNIRNTGLTDLLQGNRVIRTIPSPT